MEGEKVEGIVGEESAAARDLVQPVQIQQQAEDPVDEAVLHREETPVHHLTEDELPGCGAHGVTGPARAPGASPGKAGLGTRSGAQGAVTPNPAATSKAERSPSSWKP